ncbi:hypothetical protein [Streptomyces sp. 6N223]|uniref:hypothetical protein n=1 Tax=Streptomyces sp. 6N223 TaxID=3457412 RepID=UPI003FD40227
MANRQITRPKATGLAPPAEQEAVLGLALQREAPTSDAPRFAPEAGGHVLALLVAAPKEPKEPKAPKKV